MRLEFLAKVAVPPGKDTTSKEVLPASLRMQVGRRRANFGARLVANFSRRSNRRGVCAHLVQAGQEMGWHVRAALDYYLEAGALEGVGETSQRSQAVAAARDSASAGAFYSQVPVFFTKLVAVKRVVDPNAKEARLLSVDMVRPSTPTRHKTLGMPIVFYL